MKGENIFLGKVIVKDSAALIDKRILASILQVSPINLRDLQENERTELMHQYRYFLRSLAFPIQIVLRFTNKDSEKYLYRKRMADVEEIIKKTCKKNFKEVLVESDAFKNWLKVFLEMNARPALLCYAVIPVIAGINLAKNEIAYVEALQLLNQRTNECISRLSSVKVIRKLKSNSNRGEWEERELNKIQEKKAMIALRMFKRKGSYYSISDFRIVNNGQRKVNDYIKENFYDEMLAERQISLEIKRLNNAEISNLFDSYCKDNISLNIGQKHQYLFLKDLFSLMNKPAKMEAGE